MHDPLAAVMRVIHIVTAIAWVGGALLWGNVIGPRVMARGPPQIRRPFAEAVIPAMTRYYQIVAGLAILSGFILVGQVNGWSGYFGAFMDGQYGLWLGLGVLSAIAMAIVGFGIITPTGKKMLAAMAKIAGPPTDAQQAEVGALGKKVGILSMLVMAFGTIAAIAMALAVNAVR